MQHLKTPSQLRHSLQTFASQCLVEGHIQLFQTLHSQTQILQSFICNVVVYQVKHFQLDWELVSQIIQKFIIDLVTVELYLNKMWEGS